MVEVRHQDCIEGLREMEEEIVHLTFTSPPYYNARDYSTWPTYQEYLDFLREVFAEVYRVTKEGRMCVVNVSPVIVPRKSRSHESSRLPIPFHLFSIMEDLGWKYLDDIVWKKPEGAAKNRNGGFFQHRKPVAYKPNVVTETLFVFQKPASFLIDKVVRSYKGDELVKSLVGDGYERTNVWEINPETKSKHSAPFPLELSDKVVKYYSYVGDLVLDPFLGSGTTLLSCKNNNRRGIGFEIHEKYIKISEKRLKTT